MSYFFAFIGFLAALWFLFVFLMTGDPWQILWILLAAIVMFTGMGAQKGGRL